MIVVKEMIIAEDWISALALKLPNDHVHALAGRLKVSPATCQRRVYSSLTSDKRQYRVTY